MSRIDPSIGESLATTDTTLIARIAEGDQGALAALYDRYARIVYSLAVRILGSAELAEDVVQETFWRIWRRANTFQAPRGQVASWIFGIAHNLSIDEVRRQRVRPIPVYDQPDRPILRDMEDERSDIVGAVVADERQRIIVAALEGLPSEQRDVLQLAYFKGLSQSEIADQFRLPIGTVKTRVRLGLQKLRDMLIAQGHSPEDLGG